MIESICMGIEQSFMNTKIVCESEQTEAVWYTVPMDTINTKHNHDFTTVTLEMVFLVKP